MARQRLIAMAIAGLAVGTVSCEAGDPLAPTPPGAILVPGGSAVQLNQFVNALRERGFNVTVAEQIPPHMNKFFSVPAQSLIVGDARVNAFEYPTVEAASADAALVRRDGQPNPLAIIDWVSTPRFYRSSRLIVLYVGCSADVIRALDAVMGSPFVIGDMPCR